jgi:phytanoyl-CoA hydroxylase
MESNSPQQYFAREGFLIVHDLLSEYEVDVYRQIYEDFLAGKYNTADRRSDLSGTTADGPERIVQIMRPSDLLPELLQQPLHLRALELAKSLIGEDAALDFDMMIDKSPYSDAPTPWHQDEAYWPNLPDKRALSCWVALDDAQKDNGCMWYVPGSHLEPLRMHQQTGKGGALQCIGSEEEALPAEIKKGSCVWHHGRTVHFSRGNCTGNRRRAFIVNFRPAAMIALERSLGYDHLGKRTVKNDQAQH